MTDFEYKVVPAPQKGTRKRGVRGMGARFALTVETLMNELAAEGWDYLRSDTLPCEERSGLTNHVTKYHSILVFRRPKPGDAGQFAPRLLPTPTSEGARAMIPPPVAEADTDSPPTPPTAGISPGFFEDSRDAETGGAAGAIPLALRMRAGAPAQDHDDTPPQDTPKRPDTKT